MMVHETLKRLEEEDQLLPSSEDVHKRLLAIYKVANYYYRQYFDSDLVLSTIQGATHLDNSEEWFSINKLMLVIYTRYIRGNTISFKLYGETSVLEYRYIYDKVYRALEIPSELWSYSVSKNTIYDIDSSVIETISSANDEELELYLKLK